jgi:predicted negative regulator of RcsB-dependent stress response
MKIKAWFKGKKTILIMSLVIGLLVVTNLLNYSAKFEAQKTISQQQEQIDKLKSTLYVSNARASTLQSENNKLYKWYQSLLTAYAKGNPLKMSADDREFLKNWMDEQENNN